MSVGNDTYNLTKHDRNPIYRCVWNQFSKYRFESITKKNIYCNQRKNNGNIHNFINSAKTNSPTSQSGATALPPIGVSVLYIETSSNNHGGANSFCSFERIDIIQFTNISSYHNRFSILTKDFLKSMGRFRIQLLLEDNTWSTQTNIPKYDRYTDTSTDWTLVNLNFTVESFGTRLVYDQIDTPHAGMCFSDITITHSVY